MPHEHIAPARRGAGPWSEEGQPPRAAPAVGAGWGRWPWPMSSNRGPCLALRGWQCQKNLFQIRLRLVKLRLSKKQYAKFDQAPKTGKHSVCNPKNTKAVDTLQKPEEKLASLPTRRVSSGTWTRRGPSAATQAPRPVSDGRARGGWGSGGDGKEGGNEHPLDGQDKDAKLSVAAQVPLPPRHTHLMPSTSSVRVMHVPPAASRSAPGPGPGGDGREGPAESHRGRSAVARLPGPSPFPPRS